MPLRLDPQVTTRLPFASSVRTVCDLAGNGSPAAVNVGGHRARRCRVASSQRRDSPSLGGLFQHMGHQRRDARMPAEGRLLVRRSPDVT